MNEITRANLEEKRARIVAQRAAYVEDANRQIAAFDGALALLAELLAGLEIDNTPVEIEHDDAQ